MTSDGFARQPALDGVRAVAVAMVLLFHGGVGWMAGGYVGVSVFFTLSGFLITSLLLVEHERAGRIQVAAFVGRRARRLLPASVLCLVGVAVAARAGLLDGVVELRRDLLGSLLQVQNWVLLGSGGSYTELLAARAGRRSPLEHFWSLGIEEQCYWIWPWAVAGLVAVRSHRRRLTVLTVVTAISAASAPLIAWRWGPDAAYWSTPARLPELLVGALLAMVLRRVAVPVAWRHAGVPLLAVVVAVGVVLPADGGPAYEGALPLFAVLTAGVLAALQVPGPARRALSWRPLVAIGAVSYGLYLYHWPVYVVLDEARTGIDGVALLALRLAVTAGIAVLSYHLVELPVRRATWPPRRTIATGAALVASAALVVVVVTPVVDTEYWRAGEEVSAAALAPVATRRPLVASPVVVPAADDTPPAAADGVTATARGSVAEPPLVAWLPTRPVRIVVAGDSTAESLGVGMAAWARANRSIAEVAVAASPGCGFLRGGTVATDGVVPFAASCDEVLDDELPAVLTTLRPDVVVLLVTERDTADREWSPAEGPIGPDDPRFVARLEADYAALTRRIRDAGALPVWVRAPDVDPYWQGGDDPYVDPARRAVVEGVIDRLADRGEAAVLDFRAWVASGPLAEDHGARPDGLHWAPEAAEAVSTTWFGPQLLRLALDTSAAGPG